MSKSYGEQWDDLFRRAATCPGVRLTLSASEMEDEMDHMSKASRRTVAGLLLMLRDSWDRAQKYSDALAQNKVEY